MDLLIHELSDHVGETVTLRGWLQNFRSSGKISFLELRDGSGFIQAVAAHKELSDSSKEELSRASKEASVKITGSVARHPKQADVLEIHVSEITVLGEAAEFPLGRKEHGPDFLLDNRHLWLRSPSQWAIQRIRDEIIRATYDFFKQRNFVKFDSPIITATSCEGTTTLFELDYFDLGKGYLSQSGQLYLEAAIFSFGRVFDFGPVFRAEKSKTRKHLTEFWMMDAEMAFFDHEANMKLQEELITYIVERCLENKKEELKIRERETRVLEGVKTPFKRLTHREVVSILQKNGSEIEDDKDLGAGDETLLSSIYNEPVFIERWPKEIKAFYMKQDPEDNSRVLAADLMAPEGYGELIGGSQREDDYELLLSRMQAENLPIEPFSWYLDLRKYGSVEHSGFGFGLERLTSWIAGVSHIRETIPFPRMIYRLYP